jgi:hypothetical protein
MQDLLTRATVPTGHCLAPGISTREAQLMLDSAQHLLRASTDANGIETALGAVDADITALLQPHPTPGDTGRTRWSNPDNTDMGHLCLSP